MMFNELERMAAEKAKEAVYLDKIGAREKAYVKYKEAIDILTKLYFMTEDDTIRSVYLEKIREYQRRIQLMDTKRVVISEGDAKTTGIEEGTEWVLKDRPRVNWEDIIGIDEAKRAIRESIVYPKMRPELFPLGWPTGILLFGPPGCGKTLIGAAVANEIDAAFFYVDAATVMSKWLGESEKNIAQLFATARTACKKQGAAIIFIDEIDSLTSVRYIEVGGEARARNQLLKEMDSLTEKGKREYLYVIGATNKPWMLDEPFIRRFQKRIYVPLPNLNARAALFSYYTKDLKLGQSVDTWQLAVMTEGYSAADIHDICMEVQLKVAREFFEEGNAEKTEPRAIEMQDFLEIISKRKSSIILENLKKLEEWAAKYAT
ncbi:MAG: AAA family ATPase [Nitrososphaerota archaeon]